MVSARKKIFQLGTLPSNSFLLSVLKELPIRWPKSMLAEVAKFQSCLSKSTLHIRSKKDNTVFLSVNGLRVTLSADQQNVLRKIPANCPLFVRSNRLLSDIGFSCTLSNHILHGLQIRMFRVEKTKSGNKFEAPCDVSSNKGLYKDGSKLRAALLDPNTSSDEKNGIKIAFAEGYLNGSSMAPKRTLGILKVLQQILSISVICIIMFLIATSSLFKLGKEMAVSPEIIKVTFQDVKGINDAKVELQEIVDFLRNPEKYLRMGGKLPKGVLLVGPPGTGKTLLARALAGEAGVPFFHACGSEFDEMLVGQGARRVRDLFKAAKEQAPCVVFIDEIDTVGCKRTSTFLHPHANQTVNQLLTEMDGFKSNEGVIVLGATNRKEDLDNALLRPGRFDIEISVSSPDIQGRKEILAHYLGRVRNCNDVDVEALARGTVGFTGADIENMVNQAAIRAGGDGADCISMYYFEAARDKALMGHELKSRVLDKDVNEITAYHEAGHVLVAYFTKHSQPLHKVTIIPRGASLGHTAYLPEKDRYHVTKVQLLADIDTMMGGRAAEHLIFGPERVTSGAASDLKAATEIALRMVRDWGMSDKAGLRSFTKQTGDYPPLGESTRNMIDNEINKILQDSYDRAIKILTKHATEHKLLAEKLLKDETLDANQIKLLLGNKPK